MSFGHTNVCFIALTSDLKSSEKLGVWKQVLKPVNDLRSLFWKKELTRSKSYY